MGPFTVSFRTRTMVTVDIDKMSDKNRIFEIKLFFKIVQHKM